MRVVDRCRVIGHRERDRHVAGRIDALLADDHARVGIRRDIDDRHDGRRIRRERDPLEVRQRPRDDGVRGGDRAAERGEGQSRDGDGRERADEGGATGRHGGRSS
jgi:hypothetical protein